MKLSQKLLALLLGGSFALTGVFTPLSQADAAATNYSSYHQNYSSTETSVHNSQGNKLLQIGKQYLHTPYKFGSSSSTTRTFDCSSFVQRVFRQAGISLPRNSRQQSAVGERISISQLQVGDLIFFRSYGSSSNRITHVAIYAGNNKILHTFGKPGVTFSTFKGTSWERRVVKARRVL